MKPSLLAVLAAFCLVAADRPIVHDPSATFTADEGRLEGRWRVVKCEGGNLGCYRGQGDDGIHLLGPLSKKVVRIAPPLTITEQEAREGMELMGRFATALTKVKAPVARGEPVTLL